MTRFVGTTEKYFSKFGELLERIDVAQLDHAVEVVATAWEKGAQIITLGNGGSSMTALHYITDWNKSIFIKTGKKFMGRTLVDNVGLLMAYGNDISFADLFVEQLKNVMREGDLVVAISGSGNSENVIRAVEYANQNGGITLGLCGYSGGRLKNLAQHVIWINVNDMQLCEDLHAMFGHIVMQKLCGYL